jgi:cell fate regulator YaaT (PSP1 superfamily)
MSRFHLVRVGSLGQVGRFKSVEAMRFPRGSRVIVRTARGLEVGDVLAPPAAESLAEADGVLLRGMTIEDQLLETRLARKRQDAYDACLRRLRELRLDAILVDVEPLFDGQTLIFYFLGPPSPQLEEVTTELAEAYDAQAQIGSFADTLSHGCGPGCGTDEATGAGCGSCSTGCAVAGACSTKRGGLDG